MGSAFAFVDELSAPARERFEQTLIPLEAPAHRQLVHKGDRVGGVYLIEEGLLRVYTISAEGQETTLYWIGPGESCFFAINCTFKDVLYPAWVESEAPTRGSIVPASVFRELYTREPALQRFTFDALSGRLFEFMGILEEVVSLDLEHRLATFLLRKADAGSRVQMSQETIANHLGTAREVVSRLLRGLVARRFIRTGRGHVEIVDRPPLARFCGVERGG